MGTVKLFNDHFQNYKSYNIPKAQLIIADIPYNIGKDAYASNPRWYENGDINGKESNVANTAFFDTDNDFRISEFLHFCSKMLKKETNMKNTSPCMVVFCEYEQQFELITKAKEYGLNRYIPLVFVKPTSPQALKANMKIVGNCEYGIVLYRERLPKFNNDGRMIFNSFQYPMGAREVKKIHPTQKPIPLLQKLIEIFTDKGDVVIDPCAGSGSTLYAAASLGRDAYGFEIKKEFCENSKKYILNCVQPCLFV